MISIDFMRSFNEQYRRPSPDSRRQAIRSDQQPHGLEGSSYRELRILEEFEFSPESSQRTLSQRLGVALGVVNVLVKSLVRRGYVRASRAGWRQWAYVLTPAGVTRKVNLTVDYVDRFMDHYRRVRSIVRTSVEGQTISPDSSVGIYGAGEVAEIVFLSLRDAGVDQIEVLHPDRGAAGRFLGLDVIALASAAPERYSKVIVADTNDVRRRHSELSAAGFSDDQIITIVPLRPGDHAVVDPERGAAPEG